MKKELIINVHHIDKNLLSIIDESIHKHDNICITINEIVKEDNIKEEKSKCDDFRVTRYLNSTIQEIDHFTRIKCNNLHSLLKNEIYQLKRNSVLEMTKIARELMIDSTTDNVVNFIKNYKICIMNNISLTIEEKKNAIKEKRKDLIQQLKCLKKD